MKYFLVLVVFLCGCQTLEVGTPGHYGLNEDGMCSEGCYKIEYCDCTMKED